MKTKTKRERQAELKLRDWFAGMALQGFIANPETCSNLSHEDTAGHCYEAADAMLAERDRTMGEP